MSSLASQLAALGAGKAVTITDKKQRKAIHSKSLIYEPSVAATQDYETIFEASLEGLHDLELLDPRFSVFENSIFSPTSVDIDRNVWTSEQNERLDVAIETFLSLLAPRFHLQPAVKALEWLVRRFQVQVFNGEYLLLTVLPYYNAPVFLRILDVFPQTLPDVFSFLSTSKRYVQNPSRNLFIRAFSNNKTLLTLYQNHVQNVLVAQREYHAFLAFWSSMSIWTMISLKEQGTPEEDIVEQFITNVSAGISLKKAPDTQVAAYIILTILSTQFLLTDELRRSAVASIIKSWSKGTLHSAIACITQVVEGSSDSRYVLSDESFTAISRVKNIERELIKLAKDHNIESFLVAWAACVFNSQTKFEQVTELVTSVDFSAESLTALTRQSLDIALNSSVPISVKQELITFYEACYKLKSVDVNFNAILVSLLTQRDSNIYFLELSLQSSIKGRPLSGSPPEEVIVDSNSKRETTATVDIDAQIKSLSISENISFLSRDSSAAFSELSTSFLTLFGKSWNINLSNWKISKESQLTFFARLWISDFPSVVCVKALELFRGLLDVEQFDYQVYIPCLLMALNNESEKVRSAAASVFTDLAKMAKPTSIVGMDTIFGEGDKSGELKYLSTNEEKKLYVSVVGPKLSECVIDSTQVFIVFSGLKDAGKDLKALRGVLVTFLASHCLSVELPALKIFLIKLILRLDPKASSNLTTLVTGWFNNSGYWKQLCEEDRVDFGKLESLIVDIANPGDITSIKFLQDCITKNDYPRLSALAGEKLVRSWESIKPEPKMALLRFLVDTVVNDDITFDTMDILNRIPIGTKQFIALLDETLLEKNGNTNGSVTNVAKRRRRSSASSRIQLQQGQLASFAETHLKKLTVLLELLEKSSDLSSPKLLSQLFLLLGDVLSLGNDSKLPVLYTEQLLANCMISVVQSLKEGSKRSTKLDSSTIRVDIVVSCIRSCSSPQVQNRFLILVADLASLAPETVLHSVMPIFTFMGANTLRLDDEFSAQVIRLTIAQVIPALMSSENNQEELDFLLLSFSAAFIHIPRHRRVRLFTFLVETLGLDDSLYKLLLLLGQKYFDAKTRRKVGETKTYISFAKLFMRSFSAYYQVIAIDKYLREISLIFDGTENDKTVDRNQLHKTLLSYGEAGDLKRCLYEFIENIIDDEVIAGTQSLRLSFMLFSSQNPTDNKSIVALCRNIIASLVSQSKFESSEDVAMDGVETTTQEDGTPISLLLRVLTILPITDFVQLAKEILASESSEQLVKSLAELLRIKFGYESASDEHSIAAASDLTFALVEYLPKYASLADHILNSTDYLIAKFGDRFEKKSIIGLLDVITGPLGLQSTQMSTFITSVACCNSICTVVGALAVGKLPKILPTVITRFESSLVSEDDNDSKLIQLSVYALFGGLIKRIPTFMTSSLTKVLELVYVTKEGLSQRNSLLRVAIDNFEAAQLLSSLSKTWEHALNTGLDSILLFLDTLDTVTEGCTKKELANSSPVLSSMIIDLFDVRSKDKFGAYEINRIEVRTISSVLQIVMKLNDKAFRPMFVRLVKWGLETGQEARRVIFFKFFVKLLTSLKSIITNYYGYVLDHVCEILSQMSLEDSSRDSAKDSSREVNTTLKRAVLNSLVASFQFDREEFWQSQARFDKIQEPLIALLGNIQPNLGGVLVKAIVGLAEAVGSSDLYKVINLGVTAHMKATCSTKEKIWAIRTLKGLYTKLGEEWVAMLPQLVPIIAELLEDDDESAELEVRRNLVPVVEEVLGEPLDRYLS